MTTPKFFLLCIAVTSVGGIALASKSRILGTNIYTRNLAGQCIAVSFGEFTTTLVGTELTFSTRPTSAGCPIRTKLIRME